MARMRSGATGFLVLPGLSLGAMGSRAAIFFALAGGTPLVAAARCAGVSFCGGVRRLRLVELFECGIPKERSADYGCGGAELFSCSTCRVISGASLLDGAGSLIDSEIKSVSIPFRICTPVIDSSSGRSPDIVPTPVL